MHNFFHVNLKLLGPGKNLPGMGNNRLGSHVAVYGRPALSV